MERLEVWPYGAAVDLSVSATQVDAAAAGSAGKRRVCALSLKALEATLEGCSAPS